MPRHVEDIVHATHHPDVAVFVFPRPVAREITTGDRGEVRVLVALMIAVERAEHRRPRLLHHEQAPLIGTEALALLRDDVGDDAGKWPRAASRFGRRDAGQGRDHDAAGFRLPPRIDDRTTLGTDHSVIPHPRFGVDRLTDRTKQPQTGEIVLRRPLVAPLDEGANRCGSRVEDADLVLLDDLPEASVVRPVRRPFVHHGRGSVRQRSVDDVAVSRDPADVGGTPVRVFVLQIEDPLRRHHRAECVAARRVHDSLRFARAARGVEDEQRMLGVEFHCVAVGIDIGHQIVPPVVSVRHHVDGSSRAAHDHDALHARRLVEAVIDGLLEQNLFPAPPASVGRDDQLGLSVVVAVGDGVGTEAAEDDRVRRSDAGTGQHRDSQFGDHGHVERNSIARRDAQLLEDVRKLADLAVQVLISQDATVARLALPNDGRFVFSPRRQVPVEAVVRGVDLSADEPLRFGHLTLKDVVPFLEPVQVASQLTPETGGVVLGLVPHLLVLSLAADMSLSGKVGRRRETACFLEDTVNVVASHGEGSPEQIARRSERQDQSNGRGLDSDLRTNATERRSPIRVVEQVIRLRFQGRGSRRVGGPDDAAFSQQSRSATRGLPTRRLPR